MAVAALSTGSLSASWTNPTQSTPTIVLSANAFSSTVSSGTGTLGQSSAGFGTLSPNTTYWFEVKNSSEPDSDYISFSTSTLAAPPGAAAYSGWTTAALRANWTSGGNGPVPLYLAILSSGSSPSANGFSGNQSSATFNTFATFSGLSVNSTYFVEVRAFNNQRIAGSTTSLGGTATLPNVPTSLGPSAVGQNQVTANWGANSNPGGTLYLAQAALDAGFTSVVASSVTANTFATLTGLNANTTYFMQVAGVTGFGQTSAFTGLPSTSTLAAPPAAAAFTQVATGSLQANWFPNGNGPVPTYIAVLSSGASPSTNGFSGNQTSTTANGFAVFSGLSVNTTYYVEVAAVNNNSLPSAFTSLQGVATLPNPPAALAPGGVASSQITANWGNNSNPQGTSYLAQASIDPTFGSLVLSSFTANVSATFTALTPNSTYYMQVRAISFSGGLTTFTALPSTSTLAVPPGTAAYTGVTSASLQANWTASSNGPTPVYQAVLSSGASPSTNGFSGNQSASTLATSAVFSGLAVGATYFVDVRAVNNNSIPSAYASLGSTATLPNAPSASAPTAVSQTQLTANWGANSSPTGTVYLAQISAGSGYSTLAGSSATANTFASFAGLVPNTTYFMRVQAINSFGGGSAFSDLPSTSTLAAPPGAAAFSAVFVSSIQANWTAGGNGPAPRYQAVLSSGASPSTNRFSGNSSSFTYNTFAVFTGLALTATYYVDVQAINNNGLATSFTALGSTLTLSSVQSASPGQAQSILLNAPAGPVRIDIGDGTFAQGVIVAASIPASFPSASPGLMGFGAGVQISLTPAIQPVGAALLSISYPLPLPAGFGEDTLVIARYDEARGVWIPLVSTVDPAGGRVTAQVTHFSLFQVMQATARSGLSAVRIFPNPFRPYQGAAAVTFTDMPVAARLRVFDYRGRLLRVLQGNDAGMASWDGKDSAGVAAASGVYIVIIEGGGEKKSFRVGVER